MIAALTALLRYSATVAYGALGEAVGQKAGLLNIGLEGMMLAAAYTATVVTGQSGNPWLGLLAAIAVSLAIGIGQACFTLGMGQDQVVVGTAVNLLALGVTSTLYRITNGASGKLISVPKFPMFLGDWDAVLVALPVLAAGLAFALGRTKWGLAVRAAGEKPAAVEAAGFSVKGLRLQAALLGAATAGIGGAYLSLGIAGSFAENMTAGRGFLAIAMVTFGRWKPLWIVGSALLIGAADWGQYILQAKSIALPSQVFEALPYLLALGVLVVAGKGGQAPASLGIPYRRSA